MKAALLKPLIKKPKLDCNILSNYRPVSNLFFLSTIRERGFASLLSKCLLVSNVNGTQKSAFKCSHATETARLRVKSDIKVEDTDTILTRPSPSRVITRSSI